ncbi:MAG: hypothetical protein A3C80_02145 [Candidatus Ryanbacteria bacterium RIFCSPHIGHO2_02_FULL_45_43]|uniref:AI-2E family transporter n=1 Tax=Candidatus Ryanbacteria bacterium RIFCSPHIGHO2_01_45_13 TaxID=1802112 RepID=A0A1G2FWG0_9BACT|nr:MAG: hypothetical protein A2718_00575 [Candidatus Ryanbacteria bacterium RIFCSPHIGHO2_01_FULL_44_130]OGZ42409.1 MAG: hypothetical protein A2W41_03420 [Candidatus Ryanbacteria bacterium RIFCSPHIGHO2_01_45_13]OGZ48427.1 MAG: hypothetical protein A3C80_02145 [Candidatus Ryanbacteria bacterium RIFCSPHIGHO2_02_FULL_45_43]OGZ50291.1 MAG: hypothetical protein A3E55_00045 [Candidatus Ryanbacteria bacterium RIFCSPHIGHO2_12_FULL_44_20]OGZ51631.1 MAG: hypothetical protein A3A17_02495 [Candidatus Ryanba
MSEKLHIKISTGTFFRAIVLLIAVYLLFKVIAVIGAVLVAVVIAAAFEPAILRMKKYKIPRTITVILIYFIIFIVFLLAVYSILPSLVQEARQFIRQLPEFVTEITAQLSGRFDFLPLEVIGENFRIFIESRDFSIGQAVESLRQGASVIFGGLFSFVIIIVLSFYLSVQEQGVTKFLRIVVPENYEDYAVDLWSRTQRKIERWLQGQLLLGVIVGAIVYIGLSIMRIEYALTLAFLSAIFELIPFFGPIMAAIPGIIVATLQEPMLGLAVLILYVLVQQLENHLIYPVVVRKMIDIPPVIVILALIFGGQLAGFFGVILAIPFIVILTEMLNDRMARKQQRSE